MDPTPQYARGTNKLQISARELLQFTSGRMNNAQDSITFQRMAALALRVFQIMDDSFDTQTRADLKDTFDRAEPLITYFQQVDMKAPSDRNFPEQVTMDLTLVISSVTKRSQTYEEGKMLKHANACRCIALFLQSFQINNNQRFVEAARAVVKAFYAGADRGKLQHAVMLLF